MTDYDSFDLIKALLEKVEDLAKESCIRREMSLRLHVHLQRTW